jgi:hypothetical protein
MPKHSQIYAVGTIAVLVLCGLVSAAHARPAQGHAADSRSPTNLVPTGTRFLARLEQEMNTGREKINEKFELRTLEPIAAASGFVVRPGARIFGHISRIEPASLTGHARLWLTFDDIETKRGTLPLVAEVSSVPGEYSVRQGQSKEGEIEARSGKAPQVAEATAGGAMIGSEAGVTTHNRKAAALGAAEGGVAAFLASSGIGQELDLPKGTKLELLLDRPLYLNP